MLQNKLLTNIEDLWEKPSLSKDNKLSVEKRNEGNVVFQKGKYRFCHDGRATTEGVCLNDQLVGEINISLATTQSSNLSV